MFFADTPRLVTTDAINFKTTIFLYPFTRWCSALLHIVYRFICISGKSCLELLFIF